MTREEAISVLKETIDTNVDKSFKEWEKWDKEKHLPAVNMAIEALQAEPVKHGEWKSELIAYKDGSYGYTHTCNICGFNYYYEDKVSNFTYCPNCGAKMDGGDNEK